MEGTFHGGSIRILKAAMGRFTDSEGILTLELAAQTILTTLLSRFVPAVLYLDAGDDAPEEYRPTAAEKSWSSCSPKINWACYRADAEGKDEGYRLYLRLLLVTDFISGMTDSYAKKSLSGADGDLLIPAVTKEAVPPGWAVPLASIWRNLKGNWDQSSTPTSL